MRPTLCLLLLLYPLLAFPQEHSVPISTDGNLLILSVQNATHSAFEGVHVTVHSAPKWLVFKTPSVVLRSIPAKEQRAAEFEFRVLAVQVEQSESVMFVITDAYGRFLGRRVLRFRTFALPQETRLDLPYPNPANPITTISFELNQAAHATLEIFNVLGQRVRRLLDTHKPAGTFSVTWEGTDESGHQVASGNYIVHLTTKYDESKEVKHYNTKVLIQK